MRLNVGSLQREEDVELRVRARFIRSGWPGCLVRLFRHSMRTWLLARGRARRSRYSSSQGTPHHGASHDKGCGAGRRRLKRRKEKHRAREGL